MQVDGFFGQKIHNLSTKLYLRSTIAVVFKNCIKTTKHYSQLRVHKYNIRNHNFCLANILCYIQTKSIGFRVVFEGGGGGREREVSGVGKNESPFAD